MKQSCLPSQSASKEHNQEKEAHKPLRTSFISKKMYLSCLIIMQSCYCDYRINKPFACSRCVICVSCSVHVILTCTTRAKDHGLFFNHQQIKEVEKSSHTVSCQKLLATARRCGSGLFSLACFFFFLFREVHESWHVMIQDAIVEKCNESGASVVHIAVDKSSSEVRPPHLYSVYYCVFHSPILLCFVCPR